MWYQILTYQIWSTALIKVPVLGCQPFPKCQWYWSYKIKNFIWFFSFHDYIFFGWTFNSDYKLLWQKHIKFLFFWSDDKSFNVLVHIYFTFMMKLTFFYLKTKINIMLSHFLKILWCYLSIWMHTTTGNKDYIREKTKKYRSFRES